jgi:hypothetical protein
MRRAAKRDGNEQELIQELITYGFVVEQVNDPGLPDLVASKGINLLFEVKTKSGTLTTAQKKFFVSWQGQVHVIRNSNDIRKVLFSIYLIREYVCTCGHSELVTQCCIENPSDFACPVCQLPMSHKKIRGYIDG